MSPAVALEPSTACDEIDKPPSLTAAQFGPSPPSARLKSSEPVDTVVSEHATATLVMFAEPTVPVPPETVQLCAVGLLFTVTPYTEPDANLVANVNEPFALTLRSSPPLSCSTTVPASPDTDPPTEYVGVVVQLTATLVTLAEPIVPEPFDTEHVWPDGFVFTVTAYAAPDASDVAKVNGPFADTDRSSPPLSRSTTSRQPDTDRQPNTSASSYT